MSGQSQSYSTALGMLPEGLLQVLVMFLYVFPLSTPDFYSKTPLAFVC